MANTISLSVSSVASDILTFVITDGTTYSSPARGTLGVFLTVQKMNADATVASTITITSNTADPETDASWTVLYVEDGWYRACFIAPPDYDIATSYSLYDVSFDTATNKVYRSLQNANLGNAVSNAAFWEEIVGNNIGLLSLNNGEVNESTNADQTTFEFIISSYSQKAYATQIAKASEQYLTSTFIPDDELDTYSIMNVLLNSTTVYSSRGSYPEGERVVDRLSSIIESLN